MSSFVIIVRDWNSKMETEFGTELVPSFIVPELDLSWILSYNRFWITFSSKLVSIESGNDEPDLTNEKLTFIMIAPVNRNGIRSLGAQEFDTTFHSLKSSTKVF